MKFIMSLMMTLSFNFLWLKHPLSMGVILIFQSLNTALIMGFITKSFFFLYIIVIVMVSGVLVLFIYMASVASNEKFNSPVMLIMIVVLTMMILFMYLIMMNIEIQQYMVNEQEKFSLIKLYNTKTMYLTIMMIMYLLFTMIVVSNIVKTNEGPLRMKI